MCVSVREREREREEREIVFFIAHAYFVLLHVEDGGKILICMCKIFSAQRSTMLVVGLCCYRTDKSPLLDDSGNRRAIVCSMKNNVFYIIPFLYLF